MAASSGNAVFDRRGVGARERELARLVEALRPRDGGRERQYRERGDRYEPSLHGHSLPMALVACSAMDDVGRVAGIWRYPVKSMAAEPLDHTDVSGTASPVIAAGRSCEPAS